MKLIVQLRKNAFAVELSCARVKIRDSRDECLDDEEEPEEDEADPGFRQDPSGTIYAQLERRGDHERPADWVLPVEARKFGFQRGS